MCLAVPGRIVELQVESTSPELKFGTVDFQGTRARASLAFTPKVEIGDWVLVHAGFAIQTLTEADARRTWEFLEEADLFEEVEPPAAADRVASEP